MERYVSKPNGSNKVGENPTVNSPRPNGGKDLTIKSSNEKPWQFKPGMTRHPNAGRRAGTPNRMSADIMNALVEAFERIGDDGDVIQRVKINGKWAIVKNEKARKKGLVEYFMRSAELYRKEFVPVIARIAMPAAMQMVVQANANGTPAPTQLTAETVAELEEEVRKLGITINIFHGDGDNRPQPLVIEHDE